MTACALGAAGLAACCELSPRPDARDDLARIDDQDRCAAEKLALTAPASDLVTLGVPTAEAAAWLAVRRGPDGVEGSADDGHLDGAAAQTALGAGAMDRIAAWARGQRATPGVACGALEVRLLAINDFHGQLEPPGGSGGRVTTAAGDVPAGGATFLATWLATLTEQHPRTLVVSAGDNIGATPLISAAFHDEPTIEALDLMRLGIATVGNHEFDEGLAELHRMQRGGCHPSEGCFGGDGFTGARFEYLAANVVDDARGETVFPATTVRRFGKARIGFIGMTLSGTKEIVSPSATAGLSFLDEVPTAARYAAELRKKGVESIVLLLHEGGFTTGSHNGCEGLRGPLADLVPRLDPAIDVVIAGHTNAMHVCAIGGKLVTSAGHYGRLVTAIDLGIDEAGGDVAAKRAENVIVTRDVAPEPAMAALIARYRDLTAAVVSRIVGTLGGDLVKAPTASGEIPLGGVIADAQVAASAADPQTGADRAVVAFMNPGGIRAELLARPAAPDRPAGAITFGELFAVQPFGNDLVVMTLTGAQIERLLEEQFVSGGKERDSPRILQVSEGCATAWKEGPGVADRIDPARIRIAGKALDLAASYRIVVNGFLATGGDGFAVFKEGTARRVAGIEVDALADYLAAHPGLKAPAGARITKH